MGKNLGVFLSTGDMKIKNKSHILTVTISEEILSLDKTNVLANSLLRNIGNEIKRYIEELEDNGSAPNEIFYEITIDRVDKENDIFLGFINTRYIEQSILYEIPSLRAFLEDRK